LRKNVMERYRERKVQSVDAERFIHTHSLLLLTSSPSIGGSMPSTRYVHHFLSSILPLWL
jgi:hypothetical protein